MSDYSQATNFTAKDSLPTGNPSKVIKGSEFDTEFSAISTAVATKANKIGSGTNGALVKQDASGDLVDSTKAVPTGTIVGTTDTQTLTNKTYDDAILSGEAYFESEIDNSNSGAAKTIDWTAGNKQKVTLSANCTFTFTAPTGPTNLLLKMTQDGTGSRTVTWPAAVKWPQGIDPTLSTGAGDIDIVTFYYDGTNYYGAVGLNYS